MEISVRRKACGMRQKNLLEASEKGSTVRPRNQGILSVKRGLKTRSVGAAHGEFRTIAHQHRVIAAPQGLNFAHIIQIDNSRAMDANKAVRVEAFGSCRHRLAQHVAFLPDVQFYIVTLRLDPFD